MKWLPTSLIPSRRAQVAFAHDVFMAALSFGLSMALRLDFEIDSYHSRVMVPGTLVFAATAAVVFLSLRLYRGIWRYASMNDLVQLTKAVTLLQLLFAFEMFVLFRLEGVPRTLPFVNWFVLMALLGGPRFLYRLFKDRQFDWHLDREGETRIPVLLVGAGDEAELFIRAARAHGGGNYKAVGILSESEGRVGRVIHDVPVLGTVESLNTVVEKLGKDGMAPQRLVLTKDSIKGTEVRDLLQAADKLGMTLARTTKAYDLRVGTDTVETRPVNIEDLLGRPQQPLDRDAMAALIKDRRVMITGAGGSIGAELVRQVAALGPSDLTLVENSEFALYKIDQEVSKHAENLQRHAVIADVRDRGRMNQLMQRHKPELVFHAAALKHVPLVEENPFEGALTNIIGTRIVADACRAAGVQIMVMISTDKAINPTNVMGATKRVAEAYCQALDIERGATDTHFVTVRFGNVLGSTGSVVPLFQRQLAAGGPLTVTHPDMERFFMTVREAVELVLQASAIGAENQASNGKIFVLDMGEPVKIIDLARQVIRLAGLEPEKDIAITFSGVRPGEKLFEEIFHESEQLLPTTAAGVLLASPRTQELATVNARLDTIETQARAENLPGLLGAIAELVPEAELSAGKQGDE